MKKVAFAVFILISFLSNENIGNESREGDYRLFEYYWNGILTTESDNLHFKNWKITKSHKGALGIAQVMPATFNLIIKWSGRKDLKPSDIIIKKHNIWAGKYYFSNAYFYIYRQNRAKAISSYNMGWSNKRMNWKYVKKVVKNGRWNLW